MKEILSKQNRLYKEINSLKTKKGRDNSSKFIIEGTKNIQEALKSNFTIDRIIFSKEFISKDENQILVEEINKKTDLREKIYFINDSYFSSLSDTVTPQGILAVIYKTKTHLNIKKNGFYLILENISDPGNLGTIIRTADAANITGIILTNNSVDKYNTKVMRATMGSIFHIDVFEEYDIIDTIKAFNDSGYKVYGAASNTSRYIWEIQLKENICIIIGNETTGLSEGVLERVSERINIPMPGKSESLNASMAAGIFIYEHLRQLTMGIKEDL
jgi:TrmH family RNA methyltransferase